MGSLRLYGIVPQVCSPGLLEYYLLDTLMEHDPQLIAILKYRCNPLVLSSYYSLRSITTTVLIVSFVIFNVKHRL